MGLIDELILSIAVDKFLLVLSTLMRAISVLLLMRIDSASRAAAILA